jgi:hypothetical protein
LVLGLLISGTPSGAIMAQAFLLQLRLGFRRNSFRDGPRIEAEPLT